MGSGFDRRAILKGTLATAAMSLAAFDVIAVAAREVANLKPGEFLWMPEKSPSGPVAIIVSLPDQLVHVYRGGVRIGLSTCSTGKKGHSTPTGVFTILEKDKHHRSSTYNNAPMPNMNRLTWKGVALHAGNLPGYPASHGCVRLPLKFSELLFTVTHVGTPVIIANDHSELASVTHPGPILSSLAAKEMNTSIEVSKRRRCRPKERQENMQHAVSLLVSRTGSGAVCAPRRERHHEGPNQDPSPQRPVRITRVCLGSASSEWPFGEAGMRSGHGAGPDASAEDLIGRVQSDEKLAKQIAGLMHPGLVLVMTDAPLHSTTRSKRGFVVLAHG